MKYFFISLAFLCSIQVVFAGDCDDLTSCSETVSKLTDKSYVFPKSLNVKLQTTSNFKLHAENADQVFSSLLHANNLARLLAGRQNKIYKIVKIKDIKHQSLPFFSATAEHGPPVDLPMTDDFFTMEYRFKNIDQDQSLFTVYSIRMQLSEYGKVYAIGKTLLVTDTVPNLLASYKMAKFNDRELNVDSVHKFLAHLDESKKYFDKKFKSKSPNKK